MTMQNILHRHPLHDFVGAIDHIRSHMAVKRQTRAVYAKTHSELSAMSTRDLTDIGIDRADIPKIAAEAASMT
ncbi:DUF1127 domain-containing protein [Pacificibacter sp. AS14]|uniref:DUF1127 domain-containing protein n=1 Tax=Pacificibacter sp. AS14 TaxID=3135785 RepID=UPI00317CA48A